MKYPLIHPYRKFQLLLEKESELPLHKQFCFAFIQWGYTAKDEDKVKFVELAKEFRKGRIGQHRTLLERKARKLYRNVKKHLNREASRQGARRWGYKTLEEGIGVHSPEFRERVKENTKKGRETQAATMGSARAKKWIVYSPDGEIFHIVNLLRFCREHGLTRTAMWSTSKIPGKTYRGWHCVQVNEEWESL